MHFVAPAIVVLAIAIDGMGRQARRVATRVLVAATVAASSYAIGDLMDIGQRRMDSKTVSPIVEECLEDIEPPATILLDYRLHRIRLARPFDTWVLLFQGKGETEFAVVDAKVAFDCVVVKTSHPPFDDFQVKVGSSGDYTAYRRTDPADIDGDGIDIEMDNCPDEANPYQWDMDGDGVGNPCDPDVDGDGFDNPIDNCPARVNRTQSDHDNDGVGDRCDPDDDNESVSDSEDAHPRNANCH